MNNTTIRKAALAFGCIFLGMTSYYILKPVRDSLFLGEWGSRRLPWAHLFVLAVTLVTAWVYTRGASRLTRVRLVTSAVGFCLACIAVFWLLLTQQNLEPWRAAIAWVYFGWVSVFAVFAVTMFWSLTHIAFRSEEAAAMYGYIGAGATCGAIVGGAITKWLALVVGTEQLLLVAFFLLTPCLLLGRVLAKRSDETAAVQEPRGTVRQTSAWKVFRDSPYLCVLWMIMFLWVFIMVLDEYRHNRVIEEAFTSKDQRTAYFGSIYFYANLIGLFLSLVITRPILTRWGPRPALLFFVGIILASSVGLLVAPSFELVTITKIAYPAVGYSIGQWSRELLYTRTSTREKLVGKGYIDTVGFRAGGGFASIALITAAAIGTGADGLLTHAVTQLSYVTIPLGLLLGVLIWWICRAFHRKQSVSLANVSD